jgi:hypothetical protein
MIDWNAETGSHALNIVSFGTFSIIISRVALVAFVVIFCEIDSQLVNNGNIGLNGGPNAKIFGSDLCLTNDAV